MGGLIAAATLVLGFQSASAVARTAAIQHHPTRIAPRQVAVALPAHPALWRISKGGSTIYLFGTVHALPKGVDWFNGPLVAAFDRSNLLVTEIIDKKPEDMRDIVRAKAMLPEGQNLRAGLSPRTRAALEKALKGNGMPPAMLDGFQPWYAAVMLSTLPLMKSGYDPANGVDARLSTLAQGKGHEALETPEYQLGLFEALPVATQKRYLTEVAEGAPKITAELGAMIAAWKAGDAPRLARIMNADESDPKLAEVLLIGRTRNWAQWIAKRLETPGTVFIAVGAGHLAGKGSVQDQLKKMGITASRVQ
jgi:uncharacterized protein YbaP (TraB family)